MYLSVNVTQGTRARPRSVITDWLQTPACLYLPFGDTTPCDTLLDTLRTKQYTRDFFPIEITSYNLRAYLTDYLPSYLVYGSVHQIKVFDAFFFFAIE